MNLDITTETISPEGVTLRVVGDVDYLTTPRFVLAVTEVLAKTPTLCELRIDLADLSFCDSSGLSGLLQIQRKTSAAGIRLCLDNRPAHLDRMLDLTGTLEQLTTVASQDSDDERYEGGGSNS
jgi:anti-anti-sigma factor